MLICWAAYLTHITPSWQPAYHYRPLLLTMDFGLGWALSDIMAISSLAIKVYTAYRDAPGDYRNIADEVNSLRIIIDQVAQHFNSTPPSDKVWKEGQDVLKGCQNILEELDSLILRYNTLASPGTSHNILQRIKLSAEDIATLRARLTSNTTLLSIFIQRFD